MKKYDLHIHSKFSDGEYSVEEIVEKLKICGIDIFSITDHDNIQSIKAMKEVDKKGLIYIPGVEISCEKGKYKMHILGYNIDADNKELVKLLQDMKLRKNLRNLEIIQQLKEKSNLTEDMKNADMLYWVGMMNNFKNQAEEIVFNELIYV